MYGVKKPSALAGSPDNTTSIKANEHAFKVGTRSLQATLPSPSRGCFRFFLQTRAVLIDISADTLAGLVPIGPRRSQSVHRQAVSTAKERNSCRASRFR